MNPNEQFAITQNSFNAFNQMMISRKEGNKPRRISSKNYNNTTSKFVIKNEFSLEKIKKEIDDILNNIPGISHIEFSNFWYEWIAKYNDKQFGIMILQDDENQYVLDVYWITDYGDRMWYTNVKTKVYDSIISKNMIHSVWPSLPPRRSMEEIMSTLRETYPKESETQLSIFAKAIMEQEALDCDEWWHPKA